MALAILSLVVLILVIVISNVRKINLGIAAMAGAAILMLAGGLEVSDMLSGFNTSLIAAIPQILSTMPGLSAQTLVSSIAVGSYAVAMSPFDANGAQIMAAYAAVYTPTDQQRRHVFNQLLKLAVCILLYQSLLAILGFYRIQLF